MGAIWNRLVEDQPQLGQMEQQQHDCRNGKDEEQQDPLTRQMHTALNHSRAQHNDLCQSMGVAQDFRRSSGFWCSPGLQSGEAAFQTRLSASPKAAGFSPGVCFLLNADRISRLYENWVLYQGTTLVVPETN
jgi:hypothetical protein